MKKELIPLRTEASLRIYITLTSTLHVSLNCKIAVSPTLVWPHPKDIYYRKKPPRICMINFPFIPMTYKRPPSKGWLCLLKKDNSRIFHKVPPALFTELISYTWFLIWKHLLLVGFFICKVMSLNKSHLHLTQCF